MVQVNLSQSRRIELAANDYGCSIKEELYSVRFHIYKPIKLLGFIPWRTRIAEGYPGVYALQILDVHPEHKELVYNIASAINKFTKVNLIIDGLEETDFEYLLKD